MINQVSQATKFNLPKSIKFWIPLTFFLINGALLVTIIFTVLGYQIWYLNRGYPGVLVTGVPVAGLTQPEIEAAVSARAAGYLNRPVTIKAGNQSWTFTGQELGLRVDVAATAEQAFLVGRSGNLLADLLTHLSLLAWPQEVEPVIVYDNNPTEQVLQQLATVVNAPPRDAQLVIGPAGEVQLIPAQRGQRLHVGATRPLIEGAVFSPNPQPVNAFVQEVIPGITTEDAQGAYEQLKTLLGSPLVFKFNTSTDAAEWQLTPNMVAPMINVFETAGEDGESRLAIALEREKVAPHFEEFARVINQEPSDARLRFNEETGELMVLQHSRDGRALDMAAAYQRLEAAVNNGSRVIELPVILTPAAVPSDDLERLGIKELVSESTSYFKGSSQARANNIALAASRFDGVVAPPGQVFSFNEHLGPVTAEAGFDESAIIYGDRTAVGIGGGVCQVSTTAFRAAFFGGYELIERWAHGYRVSWYEINSAPGLDATIYTPNVDLKFRNDTDHYLLIQTETDKEAGTLTFKFFGTPTNREVIVSEPVMSNIVKHGPPIFEETPDLPKGITKQVDWAKDGVDILVTRVVKNGDTILYEDEIVSHYQPWQAVYQVGAGGS